MNSAEKTLVADIKARYRRANSEKLAIQKDMVKLRDKYGWTQQQISDATEIPQPTVSQWLRAFDEEVSAGSTEVSRLTPKDLQARSDRAVAVRVLKEASPDEVMELVSRLPAASQRRLAAATGDSYAEVRASFEDRERRLTPAERRERRDAAEALTRPIREATAGFQALGVIGHLEQATSELHEITADGSLTAKLVRGIARARDAFNAELEMASRLVGIEEEA